MRVFISLLGVFLLSSPASAIYPHGRISTGGAGSQLISQTDYTAGSLGSGDSDTRSNAANYFNSSNTLVSAATNTARFDYATGSADGWLVEPSAVNAAAVTLIAQGTGTTYSATGGSLGPDNSTNGYLVTQGATVSSNGAAGANGAIMSPFATGMVTNTNYTVSLFFDKSSTTSPYVYFSLSDQSANAAGSTFSTSTCANTGTNYTVGGATIVATGNIGSYINNYCRVWIVVSSTAWASSHAKASFGAASNANGYTTAGQKIYAWGFQFETGGYPTSYYFGTRSGDTAANSNWWNGTSGNYLMVETVSESNPTATPTRTTYCAAGKGCASSSAPSFANVWVKRICQYNASSAGATAATTAAGQAAGTPCT